MTRAKTLFVRSPQQWAVLSAPRRIEIVEALRCLAPCSLADVAVLLDRPADTLYRHVEQLTEAGVVQAVGYRKVGRHVEQIFDLVADDFQIDFAQGEAERVAVAETVRRFAGSAAKVAAAAASSGQMVLGPKRNLVIDYELTWLTPEGFAQARRLIDQWKALLSEGRKARQGQLYLTLALALPVTRRRRARPRRSKPGPIPVKAAPARSRARRTSPAAKESD